jgi:hypothetical protein
MLRDRIYFLAFIAVLFLGCAKEQTSWDVNSTLPLFKTEMSLNNVDNTYLKPNITDSSYLLSYENLIYRYKINDLQAQDTGIDAFFSLRKLKLSDRIIENSITLGQINPLFKVLNGQQADIPAQEQSNLTPTDIDASAFFETATLDTGYLDISIENNLPVNISLIVFELTNATDNTVVASDSFLNIPKDGGLAKKTIDLRGKTVTKTLKGTIKKLITQSSNGLVLIDASKGITVRLGVRNLRPSSAIAAFPSQNVIDQDEGLTLYMGGAEVKWFKVAKGQLRIKVESTIQENMSMVLSLPGALKNGQPFYQELSMPGSAGNGVSTTEQIYDMTGFLLDFRGKNGPVKDTVNTFHQILKVTLDSSGRKLAVSLKDSIKLTYRIEGLKPEYAIGYLGNSLTRTGNKTTDFGLFKGIDGNVGVKDMNVSFILKNSIGTDGRFKLHKLDGENVFSKNTLGLSANPLMNDLFVTSPKFIRGDYTETKVDLNSYNSNIKAFLENMPQKLNYDLETEISPNGNVNNYQDFVFDDSKLDVIMRVDAPATFSIGGLVLRDTQGLNLADLGSTERIKSATLFLEVENSFPVDFGLDVELLDKQYYRLGNLDITPQNGISSGVVDDKGYPIQATKSLLVVKMPREKAELLKKSGYVAISMKIKGNGKMQRLFNASKVNVKSRIQFEYEVRN